MYLCAGMTPETAGKRTRRRVLIGVPTIILVAYLCWLALIFIAQDVLVFPRWAAGSRALPAAPAGVEEWTIDVPEGAVHAWFIPGGGRSAESPGNTVVLLHGNGMLIDDWLDTAAWFTAHGWNVLLPEFRGYGRADGTPSEAALRSDTVAFIDMLAERPEVDPAGTFYYGRSIGGCLAALVAVERPPAGLILQTPPASVASMAWRYGAPPFLVRNKFDTVRALHGIGGVPVLLVEHDSDRIVPGSHLQRLREAVPDAEQLLLQGDHNILDVGEETRFHQRFKSFVESHGG